MKAAALFCMVFGWCLTSHAEHAEVIAVQGHEVGLLRQAALRSCEPATFVHGVKRPVYEVTYLEKGKPAKVVLGYHPGSRLELDALGKPLRVLYDNPR